MNSKDRCDLVALKKALEDNEDMCVVFDILEKDAVQFRTTHDEEYYFFVDSFITRMFWDELDRLREGDRNAFVDIVNILVASSRRTLLSPSYIAGLDDLS